MSFVNKAPKLTQVQVCELSEVLFSFFRKCEIPDEEIPNISVEIKYKIQPLFSGSAEMSLEGSRTIEPFIRASLVGPFHCEEGEGPGCGDGWKLARS